MCSALAKPNGLATLTGLSFRSAEKPCHLAALALRLLLFRASRVAVEPRFECAPHSPTDWLATLTRKFKRARPRLIDMRSSRAWARGELIGTFIESALPIGTAR